MYKMHNYHCHYMPNNGPKSPESMPSPELIGHGTTGAWIQDFCIFREFPVGILFVKIGQLIRKLSNFDKQGLILKLRNSSNQKSRKLSARECLSTVKSRIFSLAKLKCHTVDVFHHSLSIVAATCSTMCYLKLPCRNSFHDLQLALYFSFKL